MSDAPAQPRSRAQLGLWDTVSIIVGIVIGAGIYETPPDVFGAAGSPWVALNLWLLGGLLSLVGALCYAELATTYPRAGGDYVYLTRAFGPWLGFLFGWAQLTIILTGSIGMMAYVFADYADRLWSFPNSTVVYALAAVLLLSAMNVLGVVFGKTAQNVLSLTKVVGIGGILIAGFLVAPAAAPGPPPTGGAGADMLALALIFVLYTYGGWNDAAFVAAEMRDRKRNIPLALVLGVGGVTAIYLLVNAAYLRPLGYAGAAASKAIAADMTGAAWGEGGARFISVLIMISALGAINGLVFTGSRVYATLGADYGAFARLGRWHPRLGTPVWSLTAQALVAALMIVGIGTAAGQSGINAAFETVGLEPIAWEGHAGGGFGTLLKCTAPVFWLFFLLTGVSLFILRVKDRGRERPFSVPLFPLTPLVFCATAAWMMYRATTYAGGLSLIGLVILALGLPLYFASSRGQAQTEPESFDGLADAEEAT